MVVIGASSVVDWSTYKVIIFQSDDWGLCGWSPDLSSFRRLWKENLVQSTAHKWVEWMKSTLESPADLDQLFAILLKYKGGDDRTVVFQPAYIMSAPDYDAIEASGCKHYADVVIPEVPSSWQRGDFIAKAKEGIEKGIWHPVYHGNTHFNRFEWMKGLKADDESTMLAFKHQTFITGNNTDYHEYDPVLAANQQEMLISTGIGRFRDVFGYYPKAAIAPTYVWQNKTEKILAKYGIQVIEGKSYQQIQRRFSAKVRGKLINWLGKKAPDKPWQISMGNYNPKLKLYYLNRNVYFEPFGRKDARHGAERAYKDIVEAWEKNEPAVVCTHRINYVYLEDHWVAENLNQLELLLSMIQTHHPEAVYLTDWEVVQLYSKGTSTMQYGDSIICRNYASSNKEIRVEIPQPYQVENVIDLRRKEEINYGLKSRSLSFTAEEGNYEVILQKENQP